MEHKKRSYGKVTSSSYIISLVEILIPATFRCSENANQRKLFTFWNSTILGNERKWWKRVLLMQVSVTVICNFPILLHWTVLCVIQEAQTYAEDTGLLFMETSAKTAMNVNDLFLAIGEQPPVISIEMCIFTSNLKHITFDNLYQMESGYIRYNVKIILSATSIVPINYRTIND